MSNYPFLDEISKFMSDMGEKCDNQKLKEDFIWYSERNATTSGEYLCECMAFLERIIAENAMPQYNEQFERQFKKIYKEFNVR